MNIFFVSDKSFIESLIKTHSNVIMISPDVTWTSKKNPWDDFGYETTFQMQLYYKEKFYELPFIKILIENEKSTHAFFKEKLQKLQMPYIQFPLDDTQYISLPTDTDFYRTLFSLFEFEKDISIQILTDLRDASFIQHTNYLSECKPLLKIDGFSSSLLREMTSKKAFESGWLIIDNRTFAKDNSFELNFQLYPYENMHKILIDFSKSIFPNNINVLIGSNGTGKSQTLIYLINELLGIGKTQQINRVPVFNQIVIIAYSPFETYLTTLDGINVHIKTSYKYFGFRNTQNVFDPKLPFQNSIQNILAMLKDDKEKDYFTQRPNKYDTFISTIKKAIVFDYIGFKLSKKVEHQPTNDNIIINKEFYIIKNKDAFLLEKHIYGEYIDKNAGVVFCKDNNVIELSSGQQIFTHLISSVLSSIREDTILLLDEPELYLHPNLEIELLDMLKEILNLYKSYAVIATHSSIVVREIAKQYISVFKKVDNKIAIIRPPFETFGGDIERINSYVFFDKDVKKPYQGWLELLVKSEESIEIAIEKYKDKLNEESIILMYGIKKA